MIIEKYLVTKDLASKTITIQDKFNKVMVLFVEEAEFAIKAADQFLTESVESRGRQKYHVVSRSSFIHAFDQKDYIIIKHELVDKGYALNALKLYSVNILKEDYDDFRKEMLSCITMIKNTC